MSRPKAASFLQLGERKINFALDDAPGDAADFTNYTHCQEGGTLYSEDRPRSGTSLISPLPLLGKFFEQVLSLDCQTEETNSVEKWKWNTA